MSSLPQQQHHQQQQQPQAEKDRWLGAWQEPDKPRFDAGRSSPALVRLLREAVERGGSDVGDDNGGGSVFDATGSAAVREALLLPGSRTLVPGCGRGYDLATFADAAAAAAAAASAAEKPPPSSSSSPSSPAAETEDPNRTRGKSTTAAAAVVVGWDYVPEAVRSAREWLSSTQRKQQLPSSVVEVRVEEADFFERAREAALSPSSSSSPDSSSSSPDSSSSSSFSLAYDYTFFCALPPSSRPAWALAYAALLREPGSTLITHIFPAVPAPGRGVEELPRDEQDAFREAFRNNNKPEASDTASALRAAEGPPWPVSPRCYEEVLVPAGFELVSCDAVPATLSHKGRGGREFLAVWRQKKKEKLSAL